MRACHEQAAQPEEHCKGRQLMQQLWAAQTAALWILLLAT
jgi:hypothetical protein